MSGTGKGSAGTVAAGAVPLVLGGDHSIAEPDIRACAQAHGPVGLVHFDAHADSAPECFGAALSHGTAAIPSFNPNILGNLFRLEIVARRLSWTTAGCC